jgi:hypothetical protein
LDKSAKTAQSALFAAKMPQTFSLIPPSGLAVAEQPALLPVWNGS